MQSITTRWNLAHLGLLLALPLYAAATVHWPPGLTLSVGTLGALAWLMASERLWPHRQAWAPSGADLRRDAVFLGANAAADALAGVLLHGAAIALAAAGLAGSAARGLPVVVALPLAIALGELGPYLMHRWAHRGGWLWRVHAVHHRLPAVNASNNLTAHPINVVWNRLARVLPWLLLGFDANILLWAALFLQVQSFATHANIAGTIGPLNRLIGSAELHRWHHSTVLDEAKNFSTAIALWDQLLGTYYRPSRPGPQHVGLDNDAGWPDARDWRHLLAWPLCRC